MAKTQRIAPPVPVEHITQSILVFRGHKVLLDEDLAVLYGVATKVLLQAVKRNSERFPEDFMIQLTPAEWAALRSQNVTSNAQRGGRRMVGGAVGPHYTEFREERSVLPGVLLARVVGHSPDVGSVTLSVTSGIKLRAVVADDTEGGTRELFECPVAPLLPW